jgi:hypothetical protein
MKLTLKAPSLSHRILVYGAPKTGKTEIVGKLASRFNLLWFDLEAGANTLLKMPQEWKERINLISLADTRSYPIAIETCLKVIKGAPQNICDEHGKIECALCKKDAKPFTRVCLNELGPNDVVVFDSLTQLTNSAISHITKNQPEDYKLAYDDWGNLGKLMDIFLSHVQQAKFNVVCISHETESEMEDGKLKIVPTAGTRNFSRNTAKYFDHVIYAEVKNKKHAFGSSTGFSNNIQTGSRTDIVLEGKENPSLLDIFTTTTQDKEVTTKTQISDLQRVKATLPIYSKPF